MNGTAFAGRVADARFRDQPLLIAPFGLPLFIAVMPLSPPEVKHLWDRFYHVVTVVPGGIHLKVKGGARSIANVTASSLGAPGRCALPSG